MILTVQPNISFEDAITVTTNLLKIMGELSEDEKEKIISALVLTENGARGFFVTYLTSENNIVDQESIGVINGLKKSPEIVSELLVKNVAMSTAMRITHLRNNNQEMANSSEKVTTRSMGLIKNLCLPEIEVKIEQIRKTIKDKNGIYQDFLNRWNYDDEQKIAILKVFS